MLDKILLTIAIGLVVSVIILALSVAAREINIIRNGINQCVIIKR